VGVDGSPASRAAPCWALRQAEVTGSAVEAVTAWHFPVKASGYRWAPVTVMEAENFEESAASQLSETIAEVGDPASSVQISMSVQEGPAAERLVKAAKGADLLVVGSRGHGGFVGALIGAMSQHCAVHAPCPILIFHGAEGE
jgi:nucleotide-binding universal stress UspA family protein